MGVIARIVSENRHAARIGFEQGMHQASQRGFPASVSAEQADEIAFLDSKVHAVERAMRVVVRERDVVEKSYAHLAIIMNLRLMKEKWAELKWKRAESTNSW